VVIKGGAGMVEPTGDELEQKVLHYLGTVDKIKARTVAKSLNLEKRQADSVLRKLAKEDKIEFLYLDTTYVKLKGK
jgi:hypothetical protein